jgi:DNA mismatch endonuclease (patch repair protein)
MPVKRSGDIFSKAKRSAIMSVIRSNGNQTTELRLAALFRIHRVTGWRRKQALPGKPDFVFHRQRVVIFVDGCFWHGCPSHRRSPVQNAGYWTVKHARNRRRDIAVTKALSARGWRVMRIWEHSLRNERRVITRIHNALGYALPER